MKNKIFLEKLCTSSAPSGREHWVYPVIKEAFQEYGDVSITTMNNTYIKKKGRGKGKIMLMAHADEIFMMITDIQENGFMKFKPYGIDVKTLVSQEVIVHGKEEIRGVIGIKPPHLMSDKEKASAISIEELLIDTGCSSEYIKEQVHVGDYVTISREFYSLLNKNVTCKAIDDKAGIVAMYACAKELSTLNHDMDVYFVASCQEEVGHRGAKMASDDLKPNIGIAIDVTFDGGRLGDTERENKLGSGAVICVGPNIHPKLKKAIIDVAMENAIPYQIEVEPGNTGTDAWDIQISGLGVPTLLISIPIKYMHTSVEILNMEDVKNTGKLLAKLIEKLKYEELEELLCY